MDDRTPLCEKHYIEEVYDRDADGCQYEVVSWRECDTCGEYEPDPDRYRDDR